MTTRSPRKCNVRIYFFIRSVSISSPSKPITFRALENHLIRKMWSIYRRIRDISVPIEVWSTREDHHIGRTISSTSKQTTLQIIKVSYLKINFDFIELIQEGVYLFIFYPGNLRNARRLEICCHHFSWAS